MLLVSLAPAQGNTHRVFKIADNTFAIERSRTSLTHNGFNYKFEKARKTRSYYRCTETRTKGCKCRLSLQLFPGSVPDRKFTLFKEHNHGREGKACMGEIAVAGINIFCKIINLFVCFTECGSSTKLMQLMHNGFLFYRHYVKGDKVYWRCCKSNAALRCRARLTTISDSTAVNEVHDHNHSVENNE